MALFLHTQSSKLHTGPAGLLLPAAAAVILLGGLLAGCGTGAAEVSPSPEITAAAVTEAPAAQPTPTPAPVTNSFTVRSEGAVLRDTPSADGNLLAEVPENTVLEAADTDGDYYRCTYLGTEGWIDGWYLKSFDKNYEAGREADRLALLTASPTYEAITDQPVYTCAATRLCFRAQPAEVCQVYDYVEYGEDVTILGRDGDYYLCRDAQGCIGYCTAQYLFEGPSYAVYPGAVDLRVYLPEAQFDLLFASENNVAGEALYLPIPLLEEETAARLKQAYDIFLNDGYILKIYDAYRPLSAQKRLYSIVHDSRFIGNPAEGCSWHQYGRAVDISLVDRETGEELEMPTPMHTFKESACRYSSGSWTEEARNNVAYMTDVMKSVGFTTIQTEWWHFQYTYGTGYLDTEIDYRSLSYRPVSEYTGN